MQQLQDNYKVRTVEMQLSLQNTLKDRVSALKSNYEALLVAAKEREVQLVKPSEAKSTDFQGNYMKKEAHNLIFSTEIEKTRKKVEHVDCLYAIYVSHVHANKYRVHNCQRCRVSHSI